jgi:hypothetical protein
MEYHLCDFCRRQVKALIINTLVAMTGFTKHNWIFFTRNIDFFLGDIRRFLIWKAPVILLLGGFLFFGFAPTDLVDSTEEKNELALKKFREALQFASLN